MHDEPLVLVELPATVDLRPAAPWIDEIIQLLRRPSHEPVGLDASAVRHIDVFGLAALYESYAIAAFHHRDLRIIQPSAPMARALRLSRLHELIPVDW